MATLSAEQFNQLLAALAQQFQANSTASSNNANLASSLENRIGKFNYDPDNGLTFEHWLKRYGNFIEVDGKALDESAKVRLLVGKLGDDEYKSCCRTHSKVFHFKS